MSHFGRTDCLYFQGTFSNPQAPLPCVLGIHGYLHHDLHTLPRSQGFHPETCKLLEGRVSHPLLPYYSKYQPQLRVCAHEYLMKECQINVRPWCMLLEKEMHQPFPRANKFLSWDLCPVILHKSLGKASQPLAIHPYFWADLEVPSILLRSLHTAPCSARGWIAPSHLEPSYC